MNALWDASIYLSYWHAYLILQGGGVSGGGGMPRILLGQLGMSEVITLDAKQNIIFHLLTIKNNDNLKILN